MTIDYRIRNIVIAAALAAAAVLLTVIYVTSARSDDKAGKTSVSVYVPSKDFGIGASGSKIAGAMKTEMVKKDALVDDAVTSPAQIKGLYLTQPVYAGEQLTLNRFARANEQGIRAKIAGKQRAVQVSGDTNQVLAGTLVPGDRVDILANLKDPADQTDVKSVVALRNLRVLQTQGGDAGATVKSPPDGQYAVILGVTDAQAQRLQYVMKNADADWSFQLRPPKKPRDSGHTVDTFGTVVAGSSR